MSSTKLKKKNLDSIIYKIQPMLDFNNNFSEEQNYIVHGLIDDKMIVTVPPTTSRNSCDELYKQLKENFKQDVVIITSNIKFFRASRISESELKEIMKFNQTPKTEEKTNDLST